MSILTAAADSTFCDSDNEDKCAPLALGDNKGPDEEETTESTKSKSQLKKIAKKLKWEQTKIIRRQKTRQKRKELRKMRKADGLSVSASRKVLRSNRMAGSNCKVGIAIDMSFDHFMIEKDVSKTIKQVHHCYSINRRLKDPLQLFVCNFTGEAKTSIRKHDGWEHWDINFTEKSYMELESYPKSNIIYLTSESENVLLTVDPDKLYVIGGLVDHNSKKGLCHSEAVKNDIQHARLPIDEHMVMKTRKVLSIDHVFEIMTLVATGLTWNEALIKVLPSRKGAQLLDDVDNAESDTN